MSRARGTALAVLSAAAAVAGCNEVHWTASPYPIPLALSGPGGGLMGRGTVDGVDTPFAMVVDTGTVLTTYDSGSGQVRARTGELTLFGVSGSDVIPRLSIRGVPLFEAPLGSLGVGDGPMAVRGILAGDNLSRFTLALDYRGAAPTMTVTGNFEPCNCELAPRCDRPDVCNAVMTFSLAGGQDTALQTRTRVVIGNDQYSYPPTRVLLDTCVEPLADPLTTTVPDNPNYAVCAGDNVNVCPQPQYLQSGLDVRMIVATGFPGLALSASAYDRLRGAGAADRLFASSPVTLHLPDAPDATASVVKAGLTTLGRATAGSDPGASALALVSRERYFGPCASLARSRRHRRAYPRLGGAERESACLLRHDTRCSVGNAPPDFEPSTYACFQAISDSRVCDDDAGGQDETPTPSVVELTAAIPVYVLGDVTPLLTEINADVRTTDSTVEGVLGTEVLRRMVATIDYPGGRMIARCVDDASCKAYPRLSLPSPSDCGFCQGAQQVNACGVSLGACPVAPAVTTP